MYEDTHALTAKIYSKIYKYANNGDKSAFNVQRIQLQGHHGEEEEQHTILVLKTTHAHRVVCENKDIEGGKAQLYEDN